MKIKKEIKESISQQKTKQVKVKIPERNTEMRTENSKMMKEASLLHKAQHLMSGGETHLSQHQGEMEYTIRSPAPIKVPVSQFL